MRRIRYRRGRRSISVAVPDELVGSTCLACGGTFEGRQMNTHHWREDFTFPQVREDNLLVLRNSIRVDVIHHRVANDLRGIVEHLQREHITVEQMARLIRSMPIDMFRTFMKLTEHLRM